MRYALLLLVACSTNPGVARYRSTQPAPIAAVAPPRELQAVRLETKALP